ncbi:MAG TPA: PEP-CTERM sorting domain-containing protein [Verrucomicrobiae bacterium]|jgi:hypothetical protein|nr:PEP-CTERM sorting domain-containing protein [Verrucomicrobiae bacterium]
MKPTLNKCLTSASLAVLISPKLFAAAVTPGDILVVQVGNGSAALAGTATATFLDEYSLTGTLVQQFALPTAASGSQDALTLSGSSTAEGFLELSGDGNYVTIGGYNLAPGGTTGTSSAATVNRVVGLLNLNTGALDTSTAINGGTSGNIRSVYTANGTSFYAASSSAGVGYDATFGSASSATQLSTSPSNTRVTKVVNGQLYVTSASGTFLGVGTIGTGTPTTGSQTSTLLTGFPTTGSHSSYDYFFATPTTLYVADDGSAAAGGGIQKWVFSSGAWSLQYTLLNNGTADTVVRGLSGFVDGSGNVDLYGSTGTTAIEVTDTGASATATTIATAGANEAFRGIVFDAPTSTPEPTTLALLSLGGVAGAFFFGRRNRK